MHNYYNERRIDSGDFYTDLAIERRRADISIPGVEYEKRPCPVGSWERVKITSLEGARKILRPIGSYETLNLSPIDTLDANEIEDAKEEIAKRLCRIFDELGVLPGRLLIVGLGNASLTPDSIGPKSATRVKPTMHIRQYSERIFYDLDCSEIAVFCPGVAAASGMDSSDTTRAICERIMPDAIIAIDSIMTESRERLGKTVQISDTGIVPGGMGNLGAPITRASMGVPVIGIGVPTVMDFRRFNIASKSDLDDSPLFISPREIDDIAENAALIIGGAINQAFGLD